ncbi:MAG: glycosyltransferase family 9 protein [Rhabdochlamydiaceae bacterium]
MIKHLLRYLKPNPLNQKLKLLKKNRKHRIAIFWNRGLGDIPLGLYGLVKRIREYVPYANITFFVRDDLKDGFLLLNEGETIVVPSWRRGQLINVYETFKETGFETSDFDLVLDKADPTRWLFNQIGRLTPRLKWSSQDDALANPFRLPQACLGVHVHSETVYGYEKNWSSKNFHQLFQEWPKNSSLPIILFGFEVKETFDYPHVIDLRGKTSFKEMLSIIKNHCSHLLVPDSGILSTIYYLDIPFYLKVVSLWADPNQGVLRQKVKSPNSLLRHIHLIGKKEQINTITVKEVINALTTNE